MRHKNSLLVPNKTMLALHVFLIGVEITNLHTPMMNLSTQSSRYTLPLLSVSSSEFLLS